LRLNTLISQLHTVYNYTFFSTRYSSLFKADNKNSIDSPLNSGYQSPKIYLCLMAASEDKLSYIYGICENTNPSYQIKCFLDTGSELNIRSLSSIKDRHNISQPPKLTLLSASGHNLKLIGQYTSIMTFGGLRINIKCIVINDFPYPLLLSIALFKQYKAQFDYDKNVCTFKTLNKTSQPIPILFDRKISPDLINYMNMLTSVLSKNNLDYYEIMLNCEEYRKRFVFRTKNNVNVLPYQTCYINLSPIFHRDFKTRLCIKLNIIASNDEGLYVYNSSNATIVLPENTFMAKVEKQRNIQLFRPVTLKNNHAICLISAAELDICHGLPTLTEHQPALSCESPIYLTNCVNKPSVSIEIPYTWLQLVAEIYFAQPKLLEVKYCLDDDYELLPKQKIIIKNPASSHAVWNQPLFNAKSIMLITSGDHHEIQNISNVPQKLYKGTVLSYDFTNHLQAERDGFSALEIAEMKRLKRIRLFDLKDFIINPQIATHLHSLFYKTFSKYKSIFSMSSDLVHYCSKLEVDIVLTDDKPIFCKAYKCSFAQLKIMQQIVDQMLSQGIIKESYSEWNSPCILVPKRLDASYVDSSGTRYGTQLDPEDPNSYRFVVSLIEINKKAPLFPTNFQNISDIINNIGN